MDPALSHWNTTKQQVFNQWCNSVSWNSGDNIVACGKTKKYIKYKNIIRYGEIVYLLFHRSKRRRRTRGQSEKASIIQCSVFSMHWCVMDIKWRLWSWSTFSWQYVIFIKCEVMFLFSISMEKLIVFAVFWAHPLSSNTMEALLNCAVYQSN